MPWDLPIGSSFSSPFSITTFSRTQRGFDQKVPKYMRIVCALQAGESGQKRSTGDSNKAVTLSYQLYFHNGYLSWVFEST